VLASGTVDAASACVPHNLHLDVARAAARAGVHLLMEKPIANTLEEADEMIAAVEDAGVTMMIGFVHRFRTEVLEAKRLLEDQALGPPATAIDRFCSLGGAHPPAWVWRKAQAGGGVLMYGGIHAIDRLLWLLESPVVAVHARAHNYAGFGDVEDGLVALLEFGSGASAVLFENSPPYGRPGGWSTEVFGPEGALRIQTGEWVELTAASGGFRHEAEDDLHFHREIDEFVAAVREGREPSVPAAAGRAALEVALAVYESDARGTPVTLAPSR
jgi:predicted dehydrogenase